MSEIEKLLAAADPLELSLAGEYEAGRERVLEAVRTSAAAETAWELLMERAGSRLFVEYPDIIAAFRDYGFAAEVAQGIGADDREFTARIQGLEALYWADGSQAPPEPFLRRTLQLLARQHQLEPRHVALCFQARAAWLQTVGRAEEAEGELDLAMKEWASAGQWQRVAQIVHERGQRLLRRRRFADARDVLAAGVARVGRVDLGLVHLELLNALSEAARFSGDHALAESSSQACLDPSIVGAVPIEHWPERLHRIERGKALNALGWLRWRASRRGEAERLFEQVLQETWFNSGAYVIAEERLAALRRELPCPIEGSPGRGWGVRLFEGTGHEMSEPRLWRCGLTESPWSDADRQLITGHDTPGPTDPRDIQLALTRTTQEGRSVENRTWYLARSRLTHATEYCVGYLLRSE